MLTQKRIKIPTISFESLPSDMQINVLNWMTFLTLVTMSCTNKLLKENINLFIQDKFKELSYTATSWNQFLIGASSIYKLGRFLGYRPIVPYTFICQIKLHLTDFMTDKLINISALELIYFVLSGSFISNKEIFSSNLENLMKNTRIYSDYSRRSEIQLQDVEQAIHLLFKIYKPSRKYNSLEDEDITLDPHFIPGKV